MTDNRISEHADQSHMRKRPAEWVIADEPMTGAQRSYLKTLCEETRTKAQASRRIDELHRMTRWDVERT
jgi:hypothetical protein